MEAQTQKTTKSVLKEATIFFTGAELKHTSQVTLTKGENEIRVTGLSPQVDMNSIKVQTGNDVIITSFEFSVDHLSTEVLESPRVVQLREEIEKNKQEIRQLDIQQRINDNLKKQLEEGISKNVSGSESGLGIDELIKTMDYMKSKSIELEYTTLEIRAQIVKLQETTNRMIDQMNQETSVNNKTSGVLRMNMLAPQSSTQDVYITYFTPAANWAPSYDIQVSDTDKPVRIILRAGVRQNTGLDWEQIKPALSSGRPGNGKTAPLFSAWFLRPHVPVAAVQAPMAQNSYSYSDMVFEQEESLDEVVVTGFGQQRKTIESFVTASDESIDLHYEIALPYTIPGNGKVQNIDLQAYEAQANYKYYATPKLDKETYLLAEIPEWEKLGLMSGKANVTYNGTYLGETYLNSSNTNELQTLTLGTDPRVVVKRENVQDFSSRKAIGGDMVHQFTYQITVKNNRNQSVKMVVKDQYPISTQKNIEVNLLKKEITPWTAVNEDVGVITWEEDFNPGETKVYRISYTVRYPKDMILNL